MHEILVKTPRKAKRITIIRESAASDFQPFEFEDLDARQEDVESRDGATDESDQAKENLERELKTAYDRGFEDGRVVAKGMLEREILRHEEWVRNIDKVADSLYSEFKTQTLEMERATIALAVHIAEEILGREVTQNADLVIRQVQKAFAQIQGAQEVVVRVHPDNYEALETSRSALIAQSPQVRNFSIAPDASVEVGGCIVDTNIGRIDAQVRTQLQELLGEMMRASVTINEEPTFEHMPMPDTAQDPVAADPAKESGPVEPEASAPGPQNTFDDVSEPEDPDVNR